MNELISFDFNEKSSILLIFFFQGIVFSFLLIQKGIKHTNKSSLWLGILIFLYAMYIVPHMLGYANWYAKKTTKDFLFYIPFMQVLLIGPIVFFYTKNLLNTRFKFSRTDLFHFIPAILYAIYSLVIFVTDKIILEEYYFYADNKDKDLANWYQAVGLISMSIYLVLSLRYYSNYKRLIFDKVSYADSLLFQWVRNFMIAFLALLILRVLFFILNPDWGEFGSQFWYYIAFSFVFYYISITGYSNVIKQLTLTGEKLKVINVFEEESTVLTPTNKEKYSEKEILLWKEKLTYLMTEERIFNNPRLTLSDVSSELKTTTKTISSVVNSGFNMNFNDFVNHYRIEAVKEKLRQDEHDKTTLLGIALDCGFNSKATFNRAFKKSTSLSPKEYLEKLTKK